MRKPAFCICENKGADQLRRNLSAFVFATWIHIVVVVLGFYVPPTAKVIRRRDLGLKSHPKDWRSPGSNSRPLVYKAGSLTARPRRLLDTYSTIPLLPKSKISSLKPSSVAVQSG